MECDGEVFAVLIERESKDAAELWCLCLAQKYGFEWRNVVIEEPWDQADADGAL